MPAIRILKTQHCSQVKGLWTTYIIHDMKAYEITFDLVLKVFLCIEELTWQKAIKLAYSVLQCHQHISYLTVLLVSSIINIPYMWMTTESIIITQKCRSYWMHVNHFSLMCMEIILYNQFILNNNDVAADISLAGYQEESVNFCTFKLCNVVLSLFI